MSIYETDAKVRFITQAESPAQAEERLKIIFVAVNRLFGEKEVLTFTDLDNPDMHTTELAIRK